MERPQNYNNTKITFGSHISNRSSLGKTSKSNNPEDLLFYALIPLLAI